MPKPSFEELWNIIANTESLSDDILAMVGFIEVEYYNVSRIHLEDLLSKKNPIPINIVKAFRLTNFNHIKTVILLDGYPKSEIPLWDLLHRKIIDKY